MPNTTQNTKINAAFYHSLGKVLTESTKLVGNERYKSAHNVRSSEIWMDSISYAPTVASASQYSDNIVVRQVGVSGDPIYLYPLTQTNYQTWFIDTGTPSATGDGFIPSVDWVRGLINPSDVPNDSGLPSFGYELIMYTRDGLTDVPYGSAYYDVDYFSGLIRFDVGFTPFDTSNGLGFTFDKTYFENNVPNGSKQSYIQNINTGGPRVIAWQYVGQRLNDYSFNGDYFTNSTTIDYQKNGPTYSFYVRENSLTASLLNTDNNGGATAGYILSVDDNGYFAWVQLDSVGTSGTSGIDGTSGTSGIDGTSGTSGVDGTSGTSGIDGTSGTSGIDGTSGTSGIDGTSGTSGIDGTSGTSGIDGTSGTSGIDGTSGTSGLGVMNYYASFSDSTIQSMQAETPTVITFDTIEINNGFNLVDNSKITIIYSGIYEFQFSPQVSKSQGTECELSFWIRKNGTDVIRTTSYIKLVSNSTIQLPFVSITLELLQGDYFELIANSSTDYGQIVSVPAKESPYVSPAAPSIIANVKNIGVASVAYSSTSGTSGISGDSFTFPNDLTVSLSDNKTFGRYLNGDVIPSTGKTPAEVIMMAILEAINPTVTLTSSTGIQFNQTNINNVLNFSYSINSLGATPSSAILEWRRNNTGPWSTLESSILSTTYTHSLTDTNYNAQTFNYKYTVTDSQGASATATKNITPASYQAPSITLSVTGNNISGPESNQTREFGNISSNLNGTITRNSNLVNITSYTLQYSTDNSTWVDIGGSVVFGPGSGAISQITHNDTSLYNSSNIYYRVKVVDDYQTFISSFVTGGNNTVTFKYLVFYGPSDSTPSDSSGVRSLPSKIFVNTSGSNNFTLYTDPNGYGTSPDYRHFTIAMPSTHTLPLSGGVIDTDALNTDVSDKYINGGVSGGGLQILTVNDYYGIGVNYKIYTMVNATPYSSYGSPIGNHAHVVHF